MIASSRASGSAKFAELFGASRSGAAAAVRSLLRLGLRLAELCGEASGWASVSSGDFGMKGDRCDRDAVQFSDGRKLPGKVTRTAGFGVPDLAARGGLSTGELGRLLTDET